MILVDTNAWIAHIRRTDPRIVAYLGQQRVVTCDVVIGELALGAGIPPSLAQNLALLPWVPSPSAAETRDYIEHNPKAFRASGVGWADAQIVLAGVLAGARVYSSDAAVRTTWRKLGLRLA